MTVEDTLAERQKTHGNFAHQSETAQALKAVMRDAPNWTYLSPAMREGLEMIATKISRALHGDWTHSDTTHDISGYASLMELSLIPNGTKPHANGTKP